VLRVQFIREYTSKVDDLVKDKIESQKGESQREGGERSCGSAGNLKLLTSFICVIINHLKLRH